MTLTDVAEATGLSWDTAKDMVRAVSPKDGG